MRLVTLQRPCTSLLGRICCCWSRSSWLWEWLIVAMYSRWCVCKRRPNSVEIDKCECRRICFLCQNPSRHVAIIPHSFIGCQRSFFSKWYANTRYHSSKFFTHCNVFVRNRQLLFHVFLLTIHLANTKQIHGNKPAVPTDQVEWISKSKVIPETLLLCSNCKWHTVR